MSVSQPVNNQSTFLPTTIVFPKDFEEFLIRLTKTYSDIANIVNIKGTAIYETTETLTGEQWNNPGQPTNRRQTFREIFPFGGILSGSSLPIVHNITGVTSYTHIYGTVNTSLPDARSIPYADVTSVTNQIAVNITPTTATIMNGATAPNITKGYLILEYLKS